MGVPNSTEISHEGGGGMSVTFFSGKSEHSLDAKCRIFLPQPIRDKLGEDFVLSLTGDLRTLCFYPADVWETRYAKLSVIDETDEEGYEYYRRVLSCTFSISPDAQGRVLIPQALRTQFDLKEGGAVVLSGVGNHIELWNADTFDQSFGSAIKDRSALVKHVNQTYFSNAARNEQGDK